GSPLLYFCASCNTEKCFVSTGPATILPVSLILRTLRTSTHFKNIYKGARMKKIGLMSFALIALLAITLAAQAPAGGGQGQGGGAGRGGGGGRGGGAPLAVTPPALQTFADTLAAAINKQDAAALTKMLAMDAPYLDEDGHAIPATVWVTRITTGTPAKVFAISGSHGQLIDDNTGWVSFNYTLAETF